MSSYHRIACSVTAVILAATSWAAAQERETPRYPKPVEKKRPPTGPDGKPLVTVDGRWYSDFGYMDLTQDQWNFEGTYSCCQGEIRGEFIANQIEFFWHDPIYGNGWGYFRLPEGADRLVGVWGTEADMGSSGAWRAVRLVERDHDGEPARYRLEAEHPQLGAVTGEAVLYTAEDRVAGRMMGTAQTPSQAEDLMYRHEIYRDLEGRLEGDEMLLEWHNPLTDRRGEIHMARQAGDGFQGSWHLTDETVAPIALTLAAEGTQ